MAQGSIGSSVYTTFFAGGRGGGNCGNYLPALALLILFLAATALQLYSSVWLSSWSIQSKDAQMSNKMLPIVFGIIVIFATALAIIRSLWFFLLCTLSSEALHDAAFARLLRAPLSFFEANPTGRIMNRFSKDCGLIDEALPATFFDFAASALYVLAILILVIAINPYMAIPLPFLICAFFLLRRYYITTARIVKRLESVTRSPIFATLSECLKGLPIIRAFSMQSLVLKRYTTASDDNLRTYFAFISTSRWLGIRLDFLCYVLLIIVSYCAVALRDSIHAGLAGLMISQIITLLGAFQWVVRQSAEVEQQMTSVERMIEYTNLPIEDLQLELEEPLTHVRGGGASTAVGDSSVNVLPVGKEGSKNTIAKNGGIQQASLADALASWPQQGTLEFRGVNLRYRADLPLALRDVSFSIGAGTKLGIVGRTGSGKSTLSLALLRLVEPERGGGSSGDCTGISVSGIDVARIPLSRLRRAISTIPQDPVLYAGTVRSNLDPFGYATDAQIMAALDQVKLKGAFSSSSPSSKPASSSSSSSSVKKATNAAGVTVSGALTASPTREDESRAENSSSSSSILSYKITEGGGNCSIGERQLLCLARALLRNSKIIIMDECSANVDADTDTAIQGFIRTAFKTATVITIAHRLSTIIDCDKVLVMEAGSAIEFGSPAELLALKGESGEPLGAFNRLVTETGEAMAQSLRSEAAKAGKGE